jgi:hypothetical protein
MDLSEIILRYDDTPRVPIAVPEWGCNDGLFIKTLSQLERTTWGRENAAQMDARKSGKGPLDNGTERLVLIGLVDADNKPVFAPSQLVSLSQKSGVALNRIALAILKYNAMVDEDEDDAEKNSGMTQS